MHLIPNNARHQSGKDTSTDTQAPAAGRSLTAKITKLQLSVDAQQQIFGFQIAVCKSMIRVRWFSSSLSLHESNSRMTPLPWNRAKAWKISCTKRLGGLSVTQDLVYSHATDAFRNTHLPTHTSGSVLRLRMAPRTDNPMARQGGQAPSATKDGT